MPRYWLIAPFSSQNPELYENVWSFDLDQGKISLGWHEVGDTTQLDRVSIANVIAETYPAKPQATKTLYANMLWMFLREIEPGDIILARRGRKILSGVGKVTRSGYYSPGLNPLLGTAPRLHPNFIDVEWQSSPRNRKRLAEAS